MFRKEAQARVTTTEMATISYRVLMVERRKVILKQSTITRR